MAWGRNSLRRKRTFSRHLLWVFASCCCSTAFAQESSEQLAKELANPIASLISVPFQSNYDCCFGPLKGGEYTLNVQPVIPISINAQWNLILRTIVPVIGAQPTSPTSPQIILPDIGSDPIIVTSPQTGNTWGLGDTVQSFFLSPKAPTSNGIIWGAGPVFLYPTATSDILGAHRWGAGPTAVALKQQGPWTYGVLANHIWSFAETSSLGPDVNSTFIQPFIGYTTSTAFTTTINTESTYNWLSHRWIIPINLLFSQVVTIAGQPISLQAGPRYYATTTDQGARWGVRFNVTLLFPAK